MALRAAVTGPLVGLAGLGAVAQWLPSVVSLGQWTPLRALPGGWCRWRGPAQPKVALTFDDGPSPHTTTAVLGTLAHLGLVGTSFCLGRELRRCLGVADEIVQRSRGLGYAPAGTVARAIDVLGPIADELDRLGLRSVGLDELVPARGSS